MVDKWIVWGGPRDAVAVRATWWHALALRDAPWGGTRWARCHTRAMAREDAHGEDTQGGDAQGGDAQGGDAQGEDAGGARRRTAARAPADDVSGPRAAPSPARASTRRLGGLDLGLLLALGAGWWLAGPGFVSSNDGSHVALARALGLRGAPEIDPDRDLTLRVDVARRAGHDYSDRPPGTAFAALPAVVLGAQLDPPLAADTLATDRVHVRPAHVHYARTYAARWRDGPALVALQGTAATVGLHARAVGAAGLALLLWLLLDLGTEPWRARGVVLTLGLASLWGPYSTALFSHVTAGTLLLGLWVALRLEPRRPWAAPLAGLVGAWAVGADYLLALWVVPAVALTTPWRRWPAVLAGALPVAVAVGWYHHAAFGSVTALGYDHQSNFAFARGLRTTFDRSPVHGAWVLFGGGRGAGLLSRAPVWLLGTPGLLWLVWRGLRPAPRDGDGQARAPSPPRSADPALQLAARFALAGVPWLLALTMHHTPWGGGTRDHRYLIPALPLLAVGLALGWRQVEVRRPALSTLVRVALLAAAGVSSLRVWSAWLSWRG